MSSFNKLAHAIWQCKYHIVWCPKYRFRILKGAVERSVKEIIQQLCEWKRLEILEINIQEDHIHVILSIPPKFAISEVVGFLKGKCAIKMFDKHLNLKKRYWGRHFWARGYFCVTSGNVTEEMIKEYLEHHFEPRVDDNFRTES